MYLQMFVQQLLQQEELYKLQQKILHDISRGVIQRGSVKKLLIKLRRIHRKTPVPESILNKVAGTQICNFIKKRFQYSCFLVILRKF